MPLRHALALSALVPLVLSQAACTDQDWSHALSFVGVGEGAQISAAQPASPAAEAAAPRPSNQASAAPGLNSFCQSVAQQDAQGNDFDAPTRQRVLIESYRQCVAIFGGATR